MKDRRPMVPPHSTTSKNGNNQSSFMTTTTTTTSDYQAFHSMVCGPQRARRCIDDFSGATLFGSVTEYDDLLHQEARTYDEKNDKTWHVTNLHSLDYRYTVPYLTLGSYYLLVVFSLTGLCTVLGQTQCLQACQLTDKIVKADLDSTSSNDDNATTNSSTATMLSKMVHSMTLNTSGLQVRPEVFEYLLQESGVWNDRTRRREGNTTTTTRTTTTTTTNNNTTATITLDRIFEFDFGGGVTVLMLHVLVNNDDDNQKHLVEVYRVNTNTWLGRMGSLIMSPLHFLSKLLNQAMRKTKNC